MIRTIFATLVAISVVACGQSPSPTAPPQPAPQLSLSLFPTSAELELGESVRFTAILEDQDGRSVTDEVTWSATGGTIQPDGTFIAGSVRGQFSVHAQVESGSVGVAASASVTIQEGASTDPTSPPQTPSESIQSPDSLTIDVRPRFADVAPGQSVQFKATVLDSDGSATQIGVVWDATGGTIDPDGVYVAGADPGDYVVEARAGTTAGSATVRIAEPGDSGNDDDGGSAPTPPSSPPPSPSPSPPSSGGTEIFPGQSIQAAVDGNPAGSTFVIKSGTHTRQSVVPKEGNTFVGEDGAVLDGEGTAKHAFRGSADNVTIRNLKIINYATPVQSGTIEAIWDTADGWVIEDTEVAFSSGGGIAVGHRMVIRRSNIHHNGQIGLKGWANDALIEDSVIAHNNTGGHDPLWEAGGMKFLKSQGLVFRNNHVHNNNGRGVWFDFNNNNCVVEDNLIENNTRDGVFYEISYNGKIRNNTIRGNGGAGVMVDASPNVEIYNNTITGNGNGIIAVQNDRASENAQFGPFLLEDLWVHDNTIQFSQGKHGVIDSTTASGGAYNRNNRFDRNTYTTHSDRPFWWEGRYMMWDEWRAEGHDPNGSHSY